MKLLSILIFSFLLAACASTPPALTVPERALFADSSFVKPDNILTAEQVFAMSPEMLALAAKMRQDSNSNNKMRYDALYDALYKSGQLRLEYDAEITRTASQAFEARSGNCMSLVLMTAGFARALGLDVQFQRITSQDTWSRSGSLYFSSGHVNLVLGKRNFDDLNIFDRSQAVTIDFLPPPDADKMPTEVISERRIVAMFMNNRAAETLVEGKLDQAYWWARAAIDQDPAYLLAYNTLATVYQHHGDMDLAYRTLHFANKYDPLNTVILFNMSEVAAALGHKDEADKLRTELARLEPYPPFHFFKIGQQAMAAGDYRKARSMFVREVQRAPYYHEFHFWLAKAAFELGDLKEADKHMGLAMLSSTTRGETAIYASKLASLRLYEAKARLRPGKI